MSEPELNSEKLFRLQAEFDNLKWMVERHIKTHVDNIESLELENKLDRHIGSHLFGAGDCANTAIIDRINKIEDDLAKHIAKDVSACVTYSLSKRVDNIEKKIIDQDKIDKDAAEDLSKIFINQDKRISNVEKRIGGQEIPVDDCCSHHRFNRGKEVTLVIHNNTENECIPKGPLKDCPVCGKKL